MTSCNWYLVARTPVEQLQLLTTLLIAKKTYQILILLFILFFCALTDNENWLITNKWALKEQINDIVNEKYWSYLNISEKFTNIIEWTK